MKLINFIPRKSITITVNDADLDRIEENVKDYLTDPTHFAGPWFANREEAEDWMGDVWSETLEVVLETLGIKIEGQEEEDDDD